MCHIYQDRNEPLVIFWLHLTHGIVSTEVSRVQKKTPNLGFTIAFLDREMITPSFLKDLVLKSTVDIRSTNDYLSIFCWNIRYIYNWKHVRKLLHGFTLSFTLCSIIYILFKKYTCLIFTRVKNKNLSFYRLLAWCLILNVYWNMLNFELIHVHVLGT